MSNEPDDELSAEMQHNIVVWGIGTPRTLRVHWALHELQLPYETRLIQPRTPQMEEAEFLLVSPGKKVPALQHGTLTLTESAAITRYLMNNFSEQVWSVTERAMIDRLIIFTLMEIDATALYVIRRHEGLPDIYGEAPTATRAAYDYADRQLAVLSGFLGDQNYCVSERFSDADIHVGSILDWAMMLDIMLPENLTRYHERLRARSAYKAARKANTGATL